MSTICRKICDCSSYALAASSLIIPTALLAIRRPIALGMTLGSGIGVIFMAITIAEIARRSFEERESEESTSSFFARWTFASICALATTGIYLKSVGAVTSFAAGFFSSLGSCVILFGGIAGASVLGVGIVNLLNPNYQPREWEAIFSTCFRGTL